jgi:hypothetical protein
VVGDDDQALRGTLTRAFGDEGVGGRRLGDDLDVQGRFGGQSGGDPRGIEGWALGGVRGHGHYPVAADARRPPVSEARERIGRKQYADLYAALELRANRTAQ